MSSAVCLDRNEMIRGVGEAMRVHPAFAVVVIFVRGYRYANMLYGYEAGDRLMEAVAGLLQGLGSLGRIQTDCLALILPLEGGGEEEIKGKVMERLDAPVPFGPHMYSVGLSVGVSLYPEHGSDPSDLLRKADLALTVLWRSNELGIRFYSEEYDTRFKILGELALSMDKAFRDQEFEVFFQPQFTMSRGMLVGFEALIRWKREGKFVDPGKFVPLAETTGRIARLGEWMLERSCEEAASWPEIDGRLLSVGVNVSIPQFHHAGFVPTVERVLSRSGLSPERLELEITESVAMQSFESTLEKLRTVRARGIRLALDDFGTGFSSLSYLHRLPFSKLKVDQSFVREIQSSALQRTLTESVVHLGKGLGLTVLAEGVESEEEFDLLESMGCDLVQGYFCAEPLGAGTIARYIPEQAGRGCREEMPTAQDAENGTRGGSDLVEEDEHAQENEPR
jgi:EAL domain-containing protein (putative c-di-GMP-specific phosphodiesterase class I)/GGDEF domain-containing protein